jgi:hypothetical protein
MHAYTQRSLPSVGPGVIDKCMLHGNCLFHLGLCLVPHFYLVNDPGIFSSLKTMACHSAVQRKVRSTSVRLVVKVMIMAKAARLTDVVAWLIELDILCCTHYMVR